MRQKMYENGKTTAYIKAKRDEKKKAVKRRKRKVENEPGSKKAERLASKIKPENEPGSLPRRQHPSESRAAPSAPLPARASRPWRPPRRPLRTCPARCLASPCSARTARRSLRCSTPPMPWTPAVHRVFCVIVYSGCKYGVQQYTT